MAFHSPVFQNYAALQGDFGGAFTAPQAPTGIANIPPALGVPEFGGVNQFGGANAGQLPVEDPLAEIKNHPVFQFFNQWKGSSNEKRKTAVARLSQDFASPEAMGLPLPPGVEAKGLDKETGKATPDPSAWDKFMKFADSNPQFLLDLGAQLLAPRKQGVSQLGAIASGLAGATERLGQRRAATRKEGLAGAKTQADIASTVADTSKVPAEIGLLQAQTQKALADSYNSKLPAGKVQMLDSITDSIWKEFGGKLDSIKTKDAAKLQALEFIEGRGLEQIKAFLSQVSDTAFIAGTDQAVKDALEAQKAIPKTGVAALREEKERKTRLAAFRKNLLANPERLDAWVRQQNPGLPEEAIQAKVRAFGGKGKSVALPRKVSVNKSTEKKSITLAEEAKALSRFPGDTLKAGASPKEEIAFKKQQRRLRTASRKALKEFKKGVHQGKSELRLALRAATTDNQRRRILRLLNLKGK